MCTMDWDYKIMGPDTKNITPIAIGMDVCTNTMRQKRIEHTAEIWISKIHI